MSIVNSSRIECLSQDVCVQYSSVGKSIPVVEMFDEFDRLEEFSDRHGRSFFDSESKLFSFDGGSIGYIKEVGSLWISNLIDLFNSPKVEVDAKKKRRKLRRKNNRRKRVRFRNLKEQTDEDLSADQDLSTEMSADLDLSTNMSTEMPDPNWHEKWANLNYYQPARSLMEDQTSLQSTSDYDVYRQNTEDTSYGNNDIYSQNTDDAHHETNDVYSQNNEHLSDDRKITIIKYVPVIPRELLPFWKKSFEREKLNDNDVMATLRQMEIDIPNESRKVRRRFRPRKNGGSRLRRRNNKRRRRNRNKTSNSRSDLQTSSSEVGFSNAERRQRFEGRDPRRRPSFRRAERRSSIPLIPIYVSLLPLFLILGFLLGASISLR